MRSTLDKSHLSWDEHVRHPALLYCRLWCGRSTSVLHLCGFLGTALYNIEWWYNAANDALKGAGARGKWLIVRKNISQNHHSGVFLQKRMRGEANICTSYSFPTITLENTRKNTTMEVIIHTAVCLADRFRCCMNMDIGNVVYFKNLF